MGLREKAKGLKSVVSSYGKGESDEAGSKIPVEHRTVILDALIYGSNIEAQAHAEYKALNTYIDFVYERLSNIRLKSYTAESQEALVQLFALTVQYFSSLSRAEHSIGQFIEAHRSKLEKHFALEKENDDEEIDSWKRRVVGLTVDCISLWLMIDDFSRNFSSADSRTRYYQYNAAQGTKSDAGQKSTFAKNDHEMKVDGKFSIPSFAENVGLLPKVDAWIDATGTPGDEVPKAKLNARLLLRVGVVRIHWIFDISQHLRFTDGVLYLFCMPSRFIREPDLLDANNPDRALMSMGFKRGYVIEVMSSYNLLFGDDCKADFQDLWDGKDIPAPKDAYLSTLCTQPMDEHKSQAKLRAWKKEEFRYLWPRITKLEQYLKHVQADSFFKLLYRDRRDTYGWYTFLFAVAAFVLAFMSTALAFVQTIKAFYPSATPISLPESASTSTHPPSHVSTSGTVSPSANPSTLTQTSATSVIATTSSSFMSASMTATSRSTSTSTPKPESSSGLSTGAATGIGVGVALFACSLIVLIVFIFLRRRRRSDSYRVNPEPKSFPFPPSEIPGMKSPRNLTDLESMNSSVLDSRASVNRSVLSTSDPFPTDGRMLRTSSFPPVQEI